ncbi:hypothetical protein [Bacteroides pyogenes]|uniref:hypothetical protein n=1 Tax=Bacteroides pyogenes TaxID=310300 RepID=UPI002A82D0F4|nr:hypothetical protein [Bacteroides pyogenes]MDY4250431.1 hypothetical protein [Bacteroides pyogenes]
MAYDINVALERLEKNLQDLASAKEQVENTVNASVQLQRVVDDYVTSVNAILQETIRLKEEISEMKNQKVAEVKKAMELINNSCTEIIYSFKKGTNETLYEFNAENDKLAKAITCLQDFQAKLEHSIEISTSVDLKLNETSKNVISLQNKQNEGFIKVAEQSEREMKELAKSISDTSDSSKEQFSAIQALLKKIEMLNKDIQVKCNQIDQTSSRTYSTVEDLAKQIAEQHQASLKNIKINRWIVIVGIITLAALHFIVK